jgi:cullin-4
LLRVGDCWSLYCSQLLHIRNIFLVLDRRLHSDTTQPCAPSTSQLYNRKPLSFLALRCRSLEELGVLLFKKQWDLHPSLVHNVLSGCLATIRAERTGQLIDRQLVRRLLSMLASLNCFTCQFKPLLVADLERFFAEESARMLCDSEVSIFPLFYSKLGDVFLPRIHY